MSIERHETGSKLAIRDDQTGFTDQQIAALEQLGVTSASPGDLAVFFHQAQRTGLDPFARQIYMIARQGKQTIQTGIDGFRLIGRRAADAAGDTLGLSDTEWCGSDGVWRDVWLSDEAPAAARVSVIRNGGRFPGIATFAEYAARKSNGQLTQMWSTKAALMLAKCAEALAWRRAFPQDLSGIYTADEMQQADNNSGGQVRQVRQTQEPAGVENVRERARAQLADQPTDDQRERLWQLLTDLGMNTDRDSTLAALSDITGRAINATTDLTRSEADRVCDVLARRVDDTRSVDPDTGELPAEEPLDAELVDSTSDDSGWPTVAGGDR